MQAQRREIYEFGDFRLDTEEGVLTRNGTVVGLQPKAFEMLGVFVRSGGRVITRGELMEELWADSFVEENNISQHIRALRVALGEGENGYKYIETIPRRGFRFLPAINKGDQQTDSVDELADNRQNTTEADFHASVALEVASAASAPIETEPVRKRSFIRWPHIAALLLTLTVLFGGVLLWNYYRSPEKRARYTTEIQLAAQAWEANDLSAMKDMLARAKPETGERDFRGFEWGYLSRLYSSTTSSRPIELLHQDEIDDVAFLPDGRLLATACHDGVVRFWDVSTGALVREFPKQTGWITSIALSPDGTRLATTTIDDPSKLWDNPTGSVKLWDAATGSEVFTFSANAPSAGATVFSPDGKTLIASYGSFVKAWDVATGEELQRRPFWDKGGNPIAFSADGKLFASKSDNEVIRIWDVASGHELASFQGHTNWVMDLAFSPDSKTLITGSKDKTAKFWDINSKKLLRSFNAHNGGVNNVDFTSSGKYIATGGDDDLVRLWNAETGLEITTLKGHAGEINGLAFSPDSKKIASGGGANDNTVRVWNVPQDTARGLIRAHTKGVRAVAFSSSGKYFATASDDKSAKIWDAETEHEYRVLQGHSDTVNTLAFSPDNNTLATGSKDRKIKFWDVASGRERLTIETSQSVRQIAFSPNGALIASAHAFDGSGIRIWNVATGQLVCSPAAYDKSVWSVAFSKDGTRLISGDDNSVVTWDAATCKQVSALGGGEIGYVADYLANGKMVAMQVLNGGRSLKLINTESGEEASLIKGHDDEISWFKFSGEGRRLITSGSNNVIKIWDTVSGHELLTIHASSPELTYIDLSPDGKVLVSAGSDGMVNVFRADDY